MSPSDFKTALAKQNGPKEMAIGNVLFPAEMLGDIVPNYEGGTIESDTQQGKRTRPSGRPDTSEVTATIYLAGPESVKAVYAALYKEPTDPTQKTGNITWGGDDCITDAASVPINIHPVCESTDDYDIHVFSATLPDTFNPTFSASGDEATLELTFQMEKTDEGYFRFGTGDLSQPSIYDVETQKTVPVTPVTP